MLHPGFWNREAGPDFCGAMVQFDGERPVEGDIEIDVLPSGWSTHGHAGNPDFVNVVLHVVWESRQRRHTELPTLELRPFLDSPLRELYELLDHPTPPPLSADQQGKCVSPLRQLSPEELQRVLTAAARWRLESRATQIRARARQTGWDQTLLEGMFRALGYKNNAWAMQRLAEISPQLEEALPSHSLTNWQAALLGICGLLPDPSISKEREVVNYLKRAWNIWWRLRSSVDALALPRNVWKLRGLRPSNHPVRRIALAAHWMRKNDLPRRIQIWFESVARRKEENTKGKLGTELLEILSPDCKDHVLGEPLYISFGPTEDTSTTAGYHADE